MSDKRRKVLKNTVAFAAAVTAMSALAISASAESTEPADSIDDLLSNVGDTEAGQSTENNTTTTVDRLLGGAADYSVFVKNDFTVTGADCPGNIAVGGSASMPDDYTTGSSTVINNITKDDSKNYRLFLNIKRKSRLYME